MNPIKYIMRKYCERQVRKKMDLFVKEMWEAYTEASQHYDEITKRSDSEMIGVVKKDGIYFNQN